MCMCITRPDACTRGHVQRTKELKNAQAAAFLSSSASGAGSNGGNAAPSVVTLKNQFRQRLRDEKAKALEGGGEKRIKKQVW